MLIKKETLENIGRRICRFAGQEPDAVIQVGVDEKGQPSCAPAWLVEAMFVNKLMFANQATQDELNSLPMPAAPPEQPLVYHPDNKKNT